MEKKTMRRNLSHGALMAVIFFQFVAAAENVRRPNVVFILADDLGALDASVEPDSLERRMPTWS